MPGAAAGLADVGAGDGDPLVGGRVGQHPPQQLPVGGLDLGPLGERDAGAGHPLGELVAQPLQLAEVEDARLRRPRRDPVRDLDPAEGGTEQRCQLALEPADLPPQLLPRAALVNPRPEGIELVSAHKILHRPTAECR